MSEDTPAKTPEAKPAAPTPIRKPRGKRLLKLGVLGALVVALAFLLDHFGVTDIGIGTGQGEGESKTKTVSPNMSVDDQPKKKTSPEGNPDSGLPQADIEMYLKPTGIDVKIAPKGKDTEVHNLPSMNEVLEAMPGWFEKYTFKVIVLEVDGRFAADSAEEIRGEIEGKLAEIPSAKGTEVRIK